MAAQKDIFGFIDAGRKIRRPPLVGMQSLHEPAVGPPSFISARPRLKTKDLISLLLRHFWASTPRCPSTGLRDDAQKALILAALYPCQNLFILDTRYERSRSTHRCASR